MQAGQPSAPPVEGIRSGKITSGYRGTQAPERPVETAPAAFRETVRIPTGQAHLTGDWVMPEHPAGIVLFAHGSGSGRHSSRNKFVARVLQEHGMGTLLLDLLTPDEERVDAVTAHLRFDIPFLAFRLAEASRWIMARDAAQGLPLGYFGASTGGGAALVAAAELGSAVRAVVSRGGRPDLAGSSLPLVSMPTLLIVGGNDRVVEDLNRAAFARLRCPKQLVIVPGAGHLFEEPGTLEQVAELAATWFSDCFRSGITEREGGAG